MPEESTKGADPEQSPPMPEDAARARAPRHEFAVPPNKIDIVKDHDQAFQGFNEAMRGLDLGLNARRAFSDTLALEGVDRLAPDPRAPHDPDKASRYGVTPAALADAQRSDPSLRAVGRPADLTPEQAARVYRSHLDTSLKGVSSASPGRPSGSELLQEIEDPKTAGFLFDTLFRHGAPARANIVRDAVSDTLKGIPAAERAALDSESLGRRGVMDVGTFDAFATLANGEHADRLREHLKARRDDAKPADGDKARTSYYAALD